MVKFITVGGLASLLATNAAPQPGPQPEQPIPQSVIDQIENGLWNSEVGSAMNGWSAPEGLKFPEDIVNFQSAPPMIVTNAPAQGMIVNTPIAPVQYIQQPPVQFVNQGTPIQSNVVHVQQPVQQTYFVQPPSSNQINQGVYTAYQAPSFPESSQSYTPNFPQGSNPVSFMPNSAANLPTPQFGNGFGSRPENDQFAPPGIPQAEASNDFEHSQLVNMGAPGVVEGTDVIKSIAYRSDGNYKLEINFKGVIPLTFVDLKAGKCSQFTPGVSIVNAENMDTTLEIDMALCQKECDLRAEDMLSSIDVLNEPIDITFGIQDPHDYNRVIAKYNIQPNARYHEDYILEFNTQSEETRQLVIDDSGNFFQVDDNIQFSFMTFKNDEFQEKTYSTKASAPPGQTTFVEMCPINGFTTGKMLNVPEICFIKDLTNDKTVMMWDMGVSEGCIKDLHYEAATGNWQYPANYYHIMGYSTRTHSHNNFKITCNMRVCGNVAGNPCQQQIANCDYTRN